jgi:hypothetical protein
MPGVTDITGSCFVLRLHLGLVALGYIALFILAYTLDQGPSEFQIVDSGFEKS